MAALRATRPIGRVAFAESRSGSESQWCDGAAIRSPLVAQTAVRTLESGGRRRDVGRFECRMRDDRILTAGPDPPAKAPRIHIIIILRQTDPSSQTADVGVAALACCPPGPWSFTEHDVGGAQIRTQETCCLPAVGPWRDCVASLRQEPITALDCEAA